MNSVTKTSNNNSIKHGLDRVITVLALSFLIPFSWSFTPSSHPLQQSAFAVKHNDNDAFRSNSRHVSSALNVLADRTSSDSKVEERDDDNDEDLLSESSSTINNAIEEELLDVDVRDLHTPQNHLPPRLVPGHKAWRNHHQATLRFVRNHRGAKDVSAESINSTSTGQHNPVSALISNLITNKDKDTQQHSMSSSTTMEKTSPTSKFSVKADSTATKLRGGDDDDSAADSSGRNPLLVSSSKEWIRLEEHAKYIQTTHLKDLLMDKSRCDALCAEHDGVYLDYSRQRVTFETLRLLIDLAERQNLRGKINAMLSGEKINFTEERAVLHTALRARRDQIGTVFVDGVDAIGEVFDVLDQIKAFTEDVRSGKIRGYTGKRLRNIVSVGIGGSYLGPEFLHEVLKTEPEGINAALGYSLRFLANVDPVDVERTCTDLDPEETLIVIVSKTFTTAETMLNARTMRQWLWDFMGNDKEVVRKHVVACASVSATKNVEAFGIDTENYFFRFWDWVGGRYSLCSAAGALPLSLVYGFGLFEKFLEGARSMDEHFATAPFHKNIPVLMGLLGVWNMSFLRYNARTTLPYAEALLKLPAHIQQLDMESNGKYMTRHNIPVDYPVGEIDFGEPGTNGQHSFYQLLHMGQTVPCEFIGFVKSQHDLCLDDESLSSHDELMANFFAQPDALANGKTAEEVIAEGNPEHLVPHKVFEGNRPSLSILQPKLTAYATGQLLSLYEHRTATQGFIWDLNSFDQWGVELGKKLAIEVRSHLLDARNGDQSKPSIQASNPATSRILNYYVKNSSEDDEDDANDLCTASRKKVQTSITRKTFHEHHQPPQGHNLGGNTGKLS